MEFSTFFLAVLMPMNHSWSEFECRWWDVNNTSKQSFYFFLFFIQVCVRINRVCRSVVSMNAMSISNVNGQTFTCCTSQNSNNREWLTECLKFNFTLNDVRFLQLIAFSTLQINCTTHFCITLTLMLILWTK